MSPTPYFKLEVYAPEENVDELLAVLAAAHAGEIGRYDHCASLTPVQGTWRPLEGARPALGQTGELYSGSEVKIEMLCREEYLLEAVQALRDAHPYQEPVINIIPLANSRYGGTA
ncbi:MAG: putative GTP cyclohydrolase 1 type 2 [Chloroflexi bacterium ADurb.Bin222]|nr:MAG: putative GTP cyclohydrolase 1 type 2 [Chloroflexi bacterium ADurb.Bin222]